MLNTKFSLHSVYLSALLASICLSGIVIGVFGFPIIIRTLLIDLLILLLVLLVVRGTPSINMSLVDKIIFSLFLFYSVLLLLHILKLTGDIKSQIVTYRMFIMYPLIFSFSIRTIFRNTKVQTLVIIFNIFFSMVAIFSIFQFIFGSVLPNTLLTINNERVFGFYGEEIIRPTGLIGNTIIFSGFLLFGIAISFASSMHYNKKIYYSAFYLMIIANVLTYSRASFVGSILIVTIIYVLYKKINVLKLFSFVAIFAVLVSVLLSNFSDSLFIERLFDRNVSSQGSTATHIQEASDSLNIIHTHTFLGIGLGTQGPSYSGENKKVITDGFWFQLFVEQGGILGGGFVFIYLTSLFLCFKLDAWRENPFAAAYVAINITFIPICFLNSALYNQINYLLFWIIFFLATLKFSTD